MATPTDSWLDAACPETLTVASGPRTIDVRSPVQSGAGPYAKDNLVPFRAEEGIDRDDAVARVLALEAKTPGLVPEGFRADLAEHGKDGFFRLHMARCELASPSTVRRAGHDAALAYLLGVPNDAALSVARQAQTPVDGMHNCGPTLPCPASFTCDAYEQACTNPLVHGARYLTSAELDVEEILVRALVPLQTADMRAKRRMDDMPVFWPAHHFVRCGGNALCSVWSHIPPGAQSWQDPKVATWQDRRYVGSGAAMSLTAAEKQCKALTGEIYRDRCEGKCQDAACVAACRGCPEGP